MPKIFTHTLFFTMAIFIGQQFAAVIFIQPMIFSLSFADFLSTGFPVFLFYMSNKNKILLSESKLLRLIRNMIFVILIVIFTATVYLKPSRWYIFVVCISWVIASYILKIKHFDKFKYKLLFYILDFIAVLPMFYTFSVNKIYMSTLFLLILASDLFYTTFYEAAALTFSYLVGMLTTMFFANTIGEDIVSVSFNVLSETFVFAVFFIVFEFGLTLYSKNKDLKKTLAELTEKENELLEANKKIEEAARLKERSRIAKQIHDTTGHAITTIIMQTEAAKLIIDTDIEDAKRKIISSNITAVKALEELRESVKLLSDSDVSFNLVQRFEDAINQTTDNTNINIRSKIDETIKLPYDLSLFLYNSLKEGLNNGIRHGKSTAFFFEFIRKNDKVIFSLSDNGTGNENYKAGFGLSSMKSMAEKFNISFTFSSSETDGSEIKFIIPYPYIPD